MIELNLIDLDKTLIPFDSFRLLIKKQLSRGDCYTFFLVVIRASRLISSARFKQSFIQNLKKQSMFDTRMEEFTDVIIKSVRSEILKMIEKHSGRETINVIFSASPHEYVEKIARRLGFTGFGSALLNGKYIELKGDQKIIKLRALFPETKYHYLFAISDNRAERTLLGFFENHLLLE